LSSKSKVLNIFKSTFKQNLDWNQTKINLNKLFEYFAILELLEIDFEYSDSNHGLNRRFLNGIGNISK
jgi:hypothetical protein